jgi:hypothetical protein
MGRLNFRGVKIRTKDFPKGVKYRIYAICFFKSKNRYKSKNIVSKQAYGCGKPRYM